MPTSTATATSGSAASDLPSLSSWLQPGIVGPLSLIALEVGILSPTVEFATGVMVYLAHPLSANLILLATVLFILLTATSLQNGGAWRWTWQRSFWMGANLVSYALLFGLTTWLQNQPTGESLWMAYGGWVFLTLAVGMTAWLAFLPLGVLWRWLSDHWEKAVGSLILALSLALCTPEIRELWHVVYKPVERMTASMLRVTGNENVFRVSRGTGNPIIGAVNGVSLEVTPYCAEMESLATYILISGVLLVAFWHRIHRVRFAIFVLCGLIVLYCLAAFRLFLLIEVGSRLENSAIAVRLAHSRVSHLLFLAASLIILFGTRRWWYRGSEPDTERTLQTSEN